MNANHYARLIQTISNHRPELSAEEIVSKLRPEDLSELTNKEIGLYVDKTFRPTLEGASDG